MEEIKYEHKAPIGIKIRKARILRGMSQDDLAIKMQTSKSAVSRLENAFEIEEDVLKEVCDILEVSVEGLKKFDEETVLYVTANFYDSSSIISGAGNAPYSSFNYNNLEDISKFFEEQLNKVKEEFRELVKNK